MATNKFNTVDKYLLHKRVNNYDMFSTGKYVQHEEGAPEPLHIGNLNDMQIASIKNNKDSNVSKAIREKIKEYGLFKDRDINNIIDEHEKYYGEIEEREGTSDFYKDKPEDGTRADLLFSHTNEEKIQKRDELIKTIETFVSSSGKTALDNSNIVINGNDAKKDIQTQEESISKEPTIGKDYFYDDDLKGEDQISPYDLLYMYRDTPVADILKEEINKERERKIARTDKTDHNFSERINNILHSVERDGVDSVIHKKQNDTVNVYKESDEYIVNNFTSADNKYNKADNILQNIQDNNSFKSIATSTSVEDYFRTKRNQTSDYTLGKSQSDRLNNIRGHIPTSTASDMYTHRGNKSELTPKKHNTDNVFDKFSLYTDKEQYNTKNEKENELLKKGVMAKALNRHIV